MINIGIAGAWLNVTPYIGVGGVWKAVTGAWIGVDGAWKSMNATPMSLSASPSSLSASTNNGSISRPTVTTGPVTVSVSGGTGPYTHAWSVTFLPDESIDFAGTASAGSPTSATTTFSGQTCGGKDAPGSDSYLATDTVTDTSSGATAQISVQIDLLNNHVERF